VTVAGIRRAMPVAALVLAASLAACTTPTERKWERSNTSPATLQADDAECLTAAGIERAPRVHAGTAGILGREGDATGRGHAEYVSCMEGRGYTRAAR
jgi:hypothetical protein